MDDPQLSAGLEEHVGTEYHYGVVDGIVHTVRLQLSDGQSLIADTVAPIGGGDSAYVVVNHAYDPPVDTVEVLAEHERLRDVVKLSYRLTDGSPWVDVYDVTGT